MPIIFHSPETTPTTDPAGISDGGQAMSTRATLRPNLFNDGNEHG